VADELLQRCQTLAAVRLRRFHLLHNHVYAMFTQNMVLLKDVCREFSACNVACTDSMHRLCFRAVILLTWVNSTWPSLQVRQNEYQRKAQWHTARCTSPIAVVSHVSWCLNEGFEKGDQRRAVDLRTWLGNYFTPVL